MSNAPFSGDVHQAINPWSWAASMMAQAGFININNIQSSNPKLEKDIVETVASYGSQLNNLHQILSLILEKQPLENLNTQQQHQLQEFEELQERLSAVKRSRQQTISPAAAKAFGEQLAALKQKSPAEFLACQNALQAGMGTNTPAKPTAATSKKTKKSA